MVLQEHHWKRGDNLNTLVQDPNPLCCLGDSFWLRGARGQGDAAKVTEEDEAPSDPRRAGRQLALSPRLRWMQRGNQPAAGSPCPT